MPLENAKPGTPGFGRNIAREIEAGKPPKQAEAIAYSKARGDADRLPAHVRYNGHVIDTSYTKGSDGTKADYYVVSATKGPLNSRKFPTLAAAKAAIDAGRNDTASRAFKFNATAEDGSKHRGVIRGADETEAKARLERHLGKKVASATFRAGDQRADADKAARFAVTLTKDGETKTQSFLAGSSEKALELARRANPGWSAAVAK